MEIDSPSSSTIQWMVSLPCMVLSSKIPPSHRRVLNGDEKSLEVSWLAAWPNPVARLRVSVGRGPRRSSGCPNASGAHRHPWHLAKRRPEEVVEEPREVEQPYSPSHTYTTMGS